jgi:hypothetical protein
LEDGAAHEFHENLFLYLSTIPTTVPLCNNTFGL